LPRGFAARNDEQGRRICPAQISRWPFAPKHGELAAMEYDFALILWAAYIAVFIIILGRIILRPQREPASRLAWLIATIAVPVVGILAYLLLGEARISAKRRARYASIEAHLPHPHDNAGVRRGLARSPWAAPFALAETVNALPPTVGNRARLAANSNAAIREMVEDIDNAKSTVHLCFYIWLADNNGFRIKDALVRAARRGVKVRVLADALGRAASSGRPIGSNSKMPGSMRASRCRSAG
jgi:cardiolipin synthase